MPHLRLSISANGPVMDVLVGVSQPHATKLKEDGKPIPTAVSIRGLVDTGASITAIDPNAITSLGLVPSGHEQVLTPSTGGNPHSCALYDISLAIPLAGSHYYSIRAMPVIESELQIQGIDALIGRDVIDRGILHYDGFGRTFVLGF